MSGYSIVGQRHLTGDSGGPVARAVLPSRYGSDSEEDQVFLVASNMPATRDSVAAGAYCAVDGIGEKIAVDVLDAALPAKLLGALGTDQWQVRSEEHTSDLQSLMRISYAVFCLKNKKR